jgi:hypothetical protein
MSQLHIKKLKVPKIIKVKIYRLKNLLIKFLGINLCKGVRCGTFYNCTDT